MGAMRYCFRCGGEVEEDRGITREAECEHCSQDLHCCRNCRFHEPGASNQCAEPQAEWVVDKERANFCDFFMFVAGSRTSHRGGAGGSSAREKWDRLFKKD